jgi:copper resistance protein B
MGHAPAQPPAGVDHAAMDHGPSRTPTVTPVPSPTDEERAAAVRPTGGHEMADNARQSLVLVDRLETFESHGEQGFEWEAEGWVGTDVHKLWLRTEGEHVGDDLEDADVEVLYGRSIAAWWDVVAGVRHHFEPGQAQDMAVLGVMGLAPYKLEVEASLYLGESGYSGARVEVAYETLLTNRLVLQPSLEVNVHGQDDRAHGNGSGLGTVESGLRLRYEVTRRFAPYLGLVHEQAYGRTADFRREDGEDASDTRVMAGVRVWF